nr:MAG TPA: hypothetical protein [Caudoviricetes sp.]
MYCRVGHEQRRYSVSVFVSNRGWYELVWCEP